MATTDETVTAPTGTIKYIRTFDTESSEGSFLKSEVSKPGKYESGFNVDAYYATSRPIGLGETPLRTESGLDAIEASPMVKDNYYGRGDNTFAKVTDLSAAAGTRVTSLDDVIDAMNVTLGLPTRKETVLDAVTDLAQGYNRFKLNRMNTEFTKGFGYVFFVKPQCHIYETSSRIGDQFKNLDQYVYARKVNPTLLKEISANTRNTDSDFSFILSNAVTGFSLNDEEIEFDSYGKTYTGYNISYGKSNIKSKTGGSISITFKDDRLLDIYHIHKLWTEYINDCYRGIVDPGDSIILNKILDYVGAVYYILTAADGETILFWSKYYGIFPTSIPSTQYSWASGSPIKLENVSINYQYSFKEDYNPQTLIEFNENAKVNDIPKLGDASGGYYVDYVPTYDPSLGHSAPTMVGTPYIEECSNSNGFCYKLRFRKHPTTKELSDYLKAVDASLKDESGALTDLSEDQVKTNFIEGAANKTAAMIDNAYNMATRLGVDISGSIGRLINKYVNIR